MRLLLVEDSDRLRWSVANGLRQAGYAVDEARDGDEGLFQAESCDYDVVILDLMLPGRDGLSVLRRLRDPRGAGRNVHVLLLTARDSVEDRVTGLRAGADDYLVKPFAFEELLARVQALTRRQHGAKNPVLAIGDLEIDTIARAVRQRGQAIELTAREYALLEYLALRAGQVVSRTQIEAHIYDDRAEVMSNVVDSAVCALRRKIDRPDVVSFIRTRRGLGYVLEIPETPETPESPQE